MDKTAEIISKLKTYKEQGLSYYDARQSLLKDGYTQLQIDDAEDSFKYEEYTLSSDQSVDTHSTYPKPETPQHDDAYDKVGSILLKDSKEKSSPGFLTMSASSTYDYRLKRLNFNMQFIGNNWQKLLVSFVISSILTLSVPAIFMSKGTNNVRYCEIVNVSQSCLNTTAVAYGWPLHTAIKYEVHGQTVGVGYYWKSWVGVLGPVAGTYMDNILIVFIGTYIVVYLLDKVRERL